MRIALRSTEQLTEHERASLAALSSAVYPPDVEATWPGRFIEWSPREWSAIVSDDDSARFLAHSGVVLRRARYNDSDVTIGGIGGVMTHPEFRSQGFATAAIERCVEFFHEQGGVDFGLLVCERNLIPFYEHLGWRLFSGDFFVTQHGQRVKFDFFLPMTRAINWHKDLAGTIDLLGPPW